ncbi:MAG: acyltransferase, partial [Marmoricola sp.]|nr:acyltransferase [Marmoricola sp.]
TLRQRARTKEYAPGESIPRSWLPRTRLNPKVNQPERICSGTSVPLADLNELAGLIDSNVMGSLHATIAQTLRRYLLEKDALPGHRMVANFDIVEDTRDPRCEGNRLATARVWVPIELDDPLELARLARTCRRRTSSIQPSLGGSTTSAPSVGCPAPSRCRRLPSASRRTASSAGCGWAPWSPSAMPDPEPVGAALKKRRHEAASVTRRRLSRARRTVGPRPCRRRPSNLRQRAEGQRPGQPLR